MKLSALVIFFLLLTITNFSFAEESDSFDTFQEQYSIDEEENIEKINFMDADSLSLSKYFSEKTTNRLIRLKSDKKKINTSDINKNLSKKNREIFEKHFFLPNFLFHTLEGNFRTSEDDWKDFTLRYKANFGNFFGGAIINQDNKEDAIDYISWTANYKEKIIIGDFLPFFGQGLILGPTSLNYYPFKTESKSFIKGKLTSFENHPFSGIALKYKGEYDVLAFFSYKNLDATVKDSVFTSFYDTGIHITETELDKKDALSFMSYGARLGKNFGRYSTNTFGINFWGGKFGKDSDDFDNPFFYFSFDYDLELYSYRFIGEISFDKQLYILKLSRDINFLFRHYRKSENNYFNTPFAKFNNKKELGLMFFGEKDILEKAKMHYFFDYAVSDENDKKSFSYFYWDIEREILPKLDLKLIKKFKEEKEEIDLETEKAFYDIYGMILRYEIYEDLDFKIKLYYENPSFAGSSSYLSFDGKYSYKDFALKFQYYSAHSEDTLYIYSLSVPYEFELDNITRKDAEKYNLILSYGASRISFSGKISFSNPGKMESALYLKCSL